GQGRSRPPRHRGPDPGVGPRCRQVRQRPHRTVPGHPPFEDRPRRPREARPRPRRGRSDGASGGALLAGGPAPSGRRRGAGGSPHTVLSPAALPPGGSRRAALPPGRPDAAGRAPGTVSAGEEGKRQERSQSGDKATPGPPPDRKPPSEAVPSSTAWAEASDASPLDPPSAAKAQGDPGESQRQVEAILEKLHAERGALGGFLSHASRFD